MSALRPKADMCSATRDVRYGPKADIRPLGSDTERKVTLRAMGVHRQDTPDHFVSSRRQCFDWDTQLCAAAGRSARTHRRTLLIADLNAAESWLDLLAKPEHDFSGRLRDCVANPRRGMVKVSVRKGRACNRQHERDGRWNDAHGYRPNVGLPVLMLLAKMGRPNEFGNISSR